MRLSFGTWWMWSVGVIMSPTAEMFSPIYFNFDLYFTFASLIIHSYLAIAKDHTSMIIN